MSEELKVVVRQGRSRLLLGLAAFFVLLVVLSGSGLVDVPGLPDWSGGEDDPAARGSVIYEGQEAKSASEEFLIDIGDGEATVSVQARQNHDKSGNIFNGDFQSTNGTSSVADPDDRDEPARLLVKTDYCAEGEITTTETPVDDDDGNDDEPAQIETTITFDMGTLYVCDTTLEHTTQNDASFKQDDTPTQFHGSFVSFVAGAVEATAAAAACPTDELEEFTDPEVVSYIQEQLGERFNVAPENVEVVAGEVGTSSDETQDELRERLESYANKEDPEDPDRTFEALDITYLSGDGEAVAESCYKDPGGTDLTNLNSVDAPDPSPRA
jgi:hypothetical protein